MKNIILLFLATIISFLLVRESHSLNPEIQKYDEMMKAFQATGRRIKQGEKAEDYMGGPSLLSKRESEDITVSQPTETNSNERNKWNGGPTASTPDIYEELNKASEKHADQPWYVAGFEASKAVLLPSIVDVKKDLDNLKEKRLSDRRIIAKLYSTTKLRTNIEKYEKTLGLTLKAYLKEYKLEAVQEVNKFMDSLPKKLKRQEVAAEFRNRWNQYKADLEKSEKEGKILDSKNDPYSKTDDQIIYHYTLWRNIIERSTDPMINRLKKKFPDEETRKRLCAKIASIFLFESKDIHEAQTYQLSDQELITGLEESLGIHDEELLLMAYALLNGFNFSEEESAKSG